MTGINVLLEALEELRGLTPAHFADNAADWVPASFVRAIAARALEAFRTEAATPKATITMEVTQEQFNRLHRAGSPLAGDEALVAVVARVLEPASLVTDGDRERVLKPRARDILAAVDAHLRGES